MLSIAVLNRFGRLAARGVVIASVALPTMAASATAQRADTARRDAPRVAQRQPRPPLSPRRAFLSSLVAPGYAQSILGRPNASAFFILTEAIGVLMVHESVVNLRQARRLENDSVPLRFVDPVRGVPDTVYQAARYPSQLVRSRRAHLEDWIAALVANHIVAAADAFVAAHLWDVPLQVGFRSSGGHAEISARYRW